MIAARPRVLHSDLITHSLTRDVQQDLRVSLFLEFWSLHHLLFLQSLDHLNLLHGVGSSMTAQASFLEEPRLLHLRYGMLLKLTIDGSCLIRREGLLRRVLGHQFLDLAQLRGKTGVHV